MLPQKALNIRIAGGAALSGGDQATHFRYRHRRTPKTPGCKVPFEETGRHAQADQNVAADSGRWNRPFNPDLCYAAVPPALAHSSQRRYVVGVEVAAIYQFDGLAVPVNVKPKKGEGTSSGANIDADNHGGTTISHLASLFLRL